MDELDQIAIEAKTMESEADAAQQEILNPGAPDPAQMWAHIPMMFGSLIAMAMPELKPVYTEAACLQWGGAMSAVAQKHGWDAAETMSKWAPEIGLVFASIPLVMPTIAAIKARKKETPEQREKRELHEAAQAQVKTEEDAEWDETNESL